MRGPSNPLCIGFVAGVSDAVNFSRQFTGKGTNTSCTPPGVTMSQEADVVLSYLNRNPDKRDLAAAALLVAAMDEAWCPPAPAAPSAQYKAR
jgi:Rap1a immunity proteins